jgi:hypothetical protein
MSKQFLMRKLLVIALSVPLLAGKVQALVKPPSSLAPKVSIVFKTQDTVPGGTTNDHFANFGNPAFNDYNHVAFRATVSQVTPYPLVYAMASSVIKASNASVQSTTVSRPLHTNTWSGIWAQDRNGKLQQIIRSAPMIPDLGGFSSFSEPVYNNSNSVAFVGNYSPGFLMIPTPIGGDSNSVFRGGTGVWTSTGALTNPLHPVAFVGQPAPGYPNPLVTSVGTLNDFLNQTSGNGFQLGDPPVTFTNPATFTSFDQIALPDQGGVVILATVSTTNYYYPQVSSNPLMAMPMSVAIQPLTQQGIWAQDTSGSLQLIARQGGTILVEGTNKTIASLSFLNTKNPINAQTRNFSQDTGNLIYLANFTDGTQAGIKVLFP